MPNLRLGVLVSGRGSNLQAILDAIDSGELVAEVALVVSNHCGVPALERALRHEVAVLALERHDFSSRREHQLAIADALCEADVQLVVLAGFDRVLCPEFIRRFPSRIVNIHPSLLPAFAGGLHAQKDALEHGVKVSGCTVHFVTTDLDAGPIVLQRAVPVRDGDDEESLAARILAEEHRALPEALQLIGLGRVVVEGKRTRVIPQPNG